MIITELELEIQGIGDMKGYTLIQLEKTDNAYIYKADDGENIHYEVFKRIVVHKFDWETKTRLDTMKVTYPTTPQFGVSAWCYNSLDRARVKFSQI